MVVVEGAAARMGEMREHDCSAGTPVEDATDCSRDWNLLELELKFFVTLLCATNRRARSKTTELSASAPQRRIISSSETPL